MKLPRPDLAAQLHEVTYRYDAYVQMIIVHSLGAAVIQAAQEEEDVTFETLMSLSDDEYTAWRQGLDDVPAPLLGKSNSDKVMLMHSVLTRRSQLLFGVVSGYSLAYAAAGSLQLSVSPSPLANVQHELIAQSTDGLELLVRKTSRLSGQAQRRELAVTRRDFSALAQAVIRLETVTDRLTESNHPPEDP